MNLFIFISSCWNKWLNEKQKNITIGTVLKSSWKIVEIEIKWIPLIQSDMTPNPDRHDHSLSWLGTGTSVKSKCIYQTKTWVPWRFGLDRFHFIFIILLTGFKGIVYAVWWRINTDGLVSLFTSPAGHAYHIRINLNTGYRNWFCIVQVFVIYFKKSLNHEI